MKKNLLLTLALCLLAQWSVAQAPKWVEKAKRAVFSVVTYDESDKILNTGNGFFVTEDGIALSDYSLFKGAQRAVVINSEGTQMPVEVIMGANDMYDVVKFRVAISGKKVPALVVAPVAPTVGASVYLLPYSTQKDRSYTAGQVKEESKVEEPIIDKELERYYDDPLFSTKSKYNDDFHQGGSWSEDGKTFTPSEFSLFNFTQEQIAEALSKEFPEASLNITDEVRAFKEGGKVNSRDMNVIPEGALHARLNHMDNKDFTKKGIPVVAKDGDKLEQTAEIERNEIIFNLSVTNKLEELMKDGSAKAALEAGKLLAEEILHNTIDNTGLIKEVE